MIGLLSRIFIPNRNDIANPSVRSKYGILCGIVGICLNFVLFSFKLVAGLLSRSVSVIADAFNNLSDAAGSIVTIIGFKLSTKKADSEHPFGHGRMEYISGFVVSILIIVVSIELFKSSVEVILHPVVMDTSRITVCSLVFSIVIKFYMFLYNRHIGKKLNSSAMDAVAKDSLNDTVSTFVVLINIIISIFFKNIKFPIDGLCGVFVAVFIFINGLDSLKETINPLLGSAVDKALIESIEKDVLSLKPICGIHDLVIHDYGPGRMMISLHAEVPGDLNIFDLHEVIDKAEVKISKKYNCSTTIHMDPVDLNNEDIINLKSYILEAAKGLDPNMSVHDIRIVPGINNTNVIFDVLRPYGCKYSDEEIKRILFLRVRTYNSSYSSVIHIDDPFV